MFVPFGSVICLFIAVICFRKDACSAQRALYSSFEETRHNRLVCALVSSCFLLCFCLTPKRRLVRFERAAHRRQAALNIAPSGHILPPCVAICLIVRWLMLKSSSCVAMKLRKS